MKDIFSKPDQDALIYQDKRLYVSLASFPIVEGHTIVVWKKNIPDLRLLSRKDYEHLMDKVDEVRNALIRTLGVKKVYLMYMDEANHIHWHLIPRFNVKGFNLLKHHPSKLRDYSLVYKIRLNLLSLK